MNKSKKREPDTKKAAYQLTARERATLDKLSERRREADLAPRMKVLADGKVTTISPDHPDQAVARGLLMEALGTADD